MSIVMAGIDHTQADVDIRSNFSFTKKEMGIAYEKLNQDPGLRGSVMISTCNRMELWLSARPEAEIDPVDLICGLKGLDKKEFEGYFVVRRDDEAVDHLFRLASGLESRILGEDQIITQVKDALTVAREFFSTDHTLEVLFRQAVTAGKRVKTEAVLKTANWSVAHEALRMLAAEGFSVKGCRCMVIGNGMMGKIAATALMEQGADVTVTVRQYTKGIVDIPRFCKRINYMDRYQLLPECDLVVSATASPNYTITTDEMKKVRVTHDVMLIDLAVPRDIEISVTELPGFGRILDLDSIHVEERDEELEANLARAENIIAEEKKEFTDYVSGRDLVPRIQTLKTAASLDLDARMTPFYKKLGKENVDSESISREVQKAAGNMMNKLLFSLRELLPDEEFRDVISATEDIFPGAEKVRKS